MNKTERAKIVAYLDRQGAERVRITRNGEAHAYGQIPNSIVSGWWFAGFVADIEDKIGQEEKFLSYCATGQ